MAAEPLMLARRTLMGLGHLQTDHADVGLPEAAAESVNGHHSNTTLDVRIIAIFAIAAGALVCGLPPLFLRAFQSPDAPVARVARAFAGGIILALALVHIIPEAVMDLSEVTDFPIGGVTVLAGILALVIIDSSLTALWAPADYKERLRCGVSSSGSSDSGSSDGADHQRGPAPGARPKRGASGVATIKALGGCAKAHGHGHGPSTTAAAAAAAAGHGTADVELAMHVDVIRDTQVPGPKDADHHHHHQSGGGARGNHHHSGGSNSGARHHGDKSAHNGSVGSSGGGGASVHHSHACTSSLTAQRWLGGAAGPLTNVKQRVTAYTMELGCIFHSIIIGVGVGVITDDRQLVIVLMVALVVHQGLEGMSLGTVVALTRLSTAKKVAMVVLYSVTTSIGIAIGISVSAGYDHSSLTSKAVQGTLNGLSGGMLLYISMYQLIAEEFSREDLVVKTRLRTGMIGGLLMGAACMCVLAIWS